MSNSNYIRNVAIVGASGNSGSYMLDALLKTGKHTVTAITREGSNSKLPEGITVKKIDYERLETIVEALKGQEALVITLGGMAAPETELKLIRAAGEAGVRWIFPNEWSPDTANEALVKDIFVFKTKPATRQAITDLGKSNYIGVSTGFWYEWSLAIPPAFGIDLLNREATLYDEGETKISVSTWPQVGRTVAALLSLPIKSEGENKEACLENFANTLVYANSFTVSQKDMLESVYRVTDSKECDWKITKEPSKERYETGKKEISEGNRIGFAKMLYTRIFFPDGSGDTEHNKGSINKVLGLPEDDLDEATKRAIERAKTTKPWA